MIFKKETNTIFNHELKKTKGFFFEKIENLFSKKSKIDINILDHIEEILLSADIGTQTTIKIIKNLEVRVQKEKYKNLQDIYNLLKEEIENLIDIQHYIMEKFQFSIQLEDLSKKDYPFLIIIPEFLRRIKEMNSTMEKYIVEKDKYYQLIVNTNHILMKKILKKETSEEERKRMIQEALNLTLLSKDLLHGKNLTDFISKRLKDLIQE